MNILQQLFQESELQPAELDRVLEAYQFCRLNKGDYWLAEGQQADHIFVLESGMMRAYAIDQKGNEITTNFYGRGQIAIEVNSFFLRLPTSENIHALSDCTGWQLDFETFQELFHGLENFREFARGRLVRKFVRLKGRSLSMITDSAQERYLQLLRDHPQILQEAPLKYVASFLGVTDTSLSRIRKEIARP